jgi:CubicO group peptidase (beta-lactamase class C family)
VSDERLPATTALIVGGIASGLHSGAQVCVSKDGVVLADFAVGEVSPGLSMTPNSLTSWMSSGKPLLAVALAQLVERGQIDLEDRVVDHLPKFGANGKDGIKLVHLLTHTSGMTNDRPGRLNLGRACHRTLCHSTTGRMDARRCRRLQCWQRLGHTR